MTPYRLFVSCAPGLEPWLADELRGLGALDVKAARGGVEARGHRRVIYRLNLESGLGTHVLVRVGRAGGTRFDDLEASFGEIAWEDVLRPGVPRSAVVNVRKSRLQHTGAIAERLLRAIARRLGDGLTGADASGVPVHVRMFRDAATVSVDSSGEPLHRRGYRVTTVAAPLREDLARALVIASGWDRASPLIDPFAGSGTIPIEAAALARGLAPGRLRGFAFERMALCDPPSWQAVKEAARENVKPAVGATILAGDRDPDAIEAVRANAERAGVENDVTRVMAPVSELPLDGLEGAALVTHPPFGHRQSAGVDPRPVYQALGRRARELGDGAPLALMCLDRRLALSVDGSLRTAFLTDAGGLKVRAMVRGSATGGPMVDGEPEKSVAGEIDPD
ncbi:MAG: class I SAM-dependent RNA methyltransferase [Sandaracinaceae bacterium]